MLSPPLPNPPFGSRRKESGRLPACLAARAASLPDRLPAPLPDSRRLPDGVGTNRDFHRRATNFIRFIICRFKCAHVGTFAIFCIHVPADVHQGELRHSCDEPIRPDPVLKLSRYYNMSQLVHTQSSI